MAKWMRGGFLAELGGDNRVVRAGLLVAAGVLAATLSVGPMALPAVASATAAAANVDLLSGGTGSNNPCVY